MISKQELKEWLGHPVTQQFHESLRKARQQAQDDWANERMIGRDAYDSERKTAVVIGSIRMIDQILNIKEVEDMA